MDEEINRAFTVIYGYVPYWVSKHLNEITTAMAKFPLVNNEKPMPLSTYLLFAKAKLSPDLFTLFNAVFSEKIQDKFIQACPEMETQSKVQAAVDQNNFKAEVAAFDAYESSLEDAIVDPHLDVSPLYRYAAAVQSSYIALVSDDLYNKAIYQLRSNPYHYFSYGKEYEEMMPIAWEEI